MPDFLPVPWIRWERFQVEGVVREKESGRPLPGLVVRAFDKDLFEDDYLGEDQTDEAGHFEIRFTDADFKDWVESRPDLYLCVMVKGFDAPIHGTEIREDASHEETFDIDVPRAQLPEGSPAG